MLRKFTLCLAIVLAISMALIGCTSSPTTTSAPPAPAATSAAPASTAPPAFKYNNLLLKSNYHAAEAVITKGQNIFGDAITKATGGAVTFQHNYMGALGPSAEQVKNLGAGSFDMALLVIGYYQGDLPLYNAFMLPNLTADPLVIAKAGTELMTMPELENELKKVNLKALYVTGATSYEYMGNKPIKTPDDFKGLNI